MMDTTKMNPFQTVGSGNGGVLPAGSHYCKFMNYEIAPPKDWGDGRGPQSGIRWRHEVSRGPHQGRLVTKTTGCKPTPKTACGEMIAAVLGNLPPEGTQPDVLLPAIEQARGKEVLVLVTTDAQGKTTMRFSPVPQL
ncbi:MAG: hypothetical protein K8U57_33780 [Planctomycetes bacterium]|nr:hypothetical protein [Planctomycetota bacterium]